MSPSVVDALWALNAYADPLAWAVVALFVVAAAAERVDRAWTRRVGTLAWTAFGVFWLSVFPQFAFEMHSAIEGVLSLAGLPASLYAAWLLYTGHERGEETLVTLTRAVAVMGLVYLPFQTVPLARRWLMETVTAQTLWVVHLLGYTPGLEAGPHYGYRTQIVFTDGGHRFVTYIELACTGLGSMAIFGGVVAAVRAPLSRKASALALAIPTIWVLNVARNAFIAVAFGDQLLQVFVPQVTALLGYEEEGLVSFFLADRVVSQSLSVVALVGIAWLVSRRLPEVLDLAEELLYFLTGREFDFDRPGGGDGGDGGAADAPERGVRADGRG